VTGEGLHPRENGEACDDVTLDNPKLLTLEEAVSWRQKQGSAGQRVVLTNGVFDLLHTGHLYFLKEAKREGDALIIALNSDESVRKLKGPLRPVQTEEQRAYALGALECVDAIVVFRQARLAAEIRALGPDIYCKAGDYLKNPLNPTEHKLNPEEVAALEAVKARIKFLAFLPGFSTTTLIARIKAAGEI
jgi:rfaE bifunctional protein nucleotidyltransferase chain/domain